MASNEKFLTQFTFFAGDKKASYYAVASGICNVFNKYHLVKGFECVAIESKGSEDNLKLLANEEADLGVIKTLDFNKSFIKNAEILQNKTQFVAKIYDENLTILTRKNIGIKNLSDVNNKIVNIGGIGSTSALIIEKYFSQYSIKPQKIVNFGASEAFKQLCGNKIDSAIDVWVYFIGHPNDGYKQALQECDLELIALNDNEINNFLKISPFLKPGNITENIYPQIYKNIKTISSSTIIASRPNFNPEIVSLIQDILINRKAELIKENQIFKSF